MWDEAYDYVVVGGGSGGSVVAGRLASSGGRVLVLEAGGTDRRPEVAVPAAAALVYRRASWPYEIEPDASREGRADPRRVARILGGGGTVNSMVFVRGHRLDFDGWAAAGATGWEFESVLSSFKKLESWQGGENEYRGGDGPIAVCVQQNQTPACHAWIETAARSGYLANDDHNGAAGLEGAFFTQANQRRGRRSHSSKEYLARSAKLRVRTGAFVVRIVIDGRRATGVEYRHRGTMRRARADAEVVLGSAGALASPKLLMLSGVGPADELSAHGIETKRHIPEVGKNLQDHVLVLQSYRARTTTANQLRGRALVAEALSYGLFGRGVLTSTAVRAMAMHHSRASDAAPDTQLLFSDFILSRSVRSDGSVRVGLPQEAGFTTGSMYLTPRTRGQVRLRSSTPDATPIIEHQLLGDGDDLRAVVDGMAAARDLIELGPIAELAGDPAPDVAGCRTRAEMEQYARARASSPSHLVGTCRMGSDDRAVVDSELKVRGVDGLRVADASIMPTVTRGNTNAPTMMIGERAAELIQGGAPRAESNRTRTRSDDG